jgi:hypothetical protein
MSDYGKSLANEGKYSEAVCTSPCMRAARICGQALLDWSWDQLALRTPRRRSTSYRQRFKVACGLADVSV